MPPCKFTIGIGILSILLLLILLHLWMVSPGAVVTPCKFTFESGLLGLLILLHLWMMRLDAQSVLRLQLRAFKSLLLLHPPRGRGMRR